MWWGEEDRAYRTSYKRRRLKGKIIPGNHRKIELSNAGKGFVLRSLAFILEARIPRLSSLSDSIPSVVIFCEKLSL